MLYYKCQEGWETLKDHPIRRARDLKPVQFVVAHLKTPFFISMKQSFKSTIKIKLIQAAINYSKLLNKEIVIRSSSFDYSDTYRIRFFKTNFLHLTGVSTALKPEAFFVKCYQGFINEDDFSVESTKEQKGLVRLKMKHLPQISDFFNDNLLVQENFEKGNIKCLIATSDGRCTIGFVDAKYHVRPKTILDKNHLRKDKRIIVVKPEIILI